MAIYHLHISSGSRSGGQSAGAKIDYIDRKGKYKDRPDKCLATGEQLPEWATTSKEFWTAVDKHERANAKLFMEVEFALPRELNLEQQKEVVQKFAQVNIPKQPYSWAIHAGKGNNPHCHLIFSERALDGVKRDSETFFKRANKKAPEKGGAAKKRFLKSTDFLKSIRKSWETHANEALKTAKKGVRIDCRTLKAQGIDRTPQVHLGPNRIGRIEREVTEIYDNAEENGKQGERDLSGIARKLAEKEARGRRNIHEFNQAHEQLVERLRKRKRVSARDLPGVKELHERSAECFGLPEVRRERAELASQCFVKDDLNRRKNDINRGEVRRDRQRGYRLRSKQSSERYRGIVGVFTEWVSRVKTEIYRIRATISILQERNPYQFVKLTSKMSLRERGLKGVEPAQPQSRGVRR